MDSFRKNNLANFVSFSGIDGAGKSTQIEALCTWLREDSRKVLVIRFWDDVARLTTLRESTGHRLFKGDNGIGTPALPINRRDKNVKSSLMTGVRLILYFLDALSLRAAVRKALRSDADLANLPLGNPAIRMYIRLINKIVPKPQISYFLDADPAKARERKPEYPLEFLHTNRQSFLELSDQIGGISVIPSMPIQEVKRAIFRLAFEKISFRALDGKSKGDAPVNADSIQLAGLDRA
jgi:hypothetical protein